MNRQSRQDAIAISELRQLGKLRRLISPRPRVYLGLLLTETGKYWLVQLTTKDRKVGLVKEYNDPNRPSEHLKLALESPRAIEVTLTEQDKE